LRRYAGGDARAGRWHALLSLGTNDEEGPMQGDKLLGLILLIFGVLALAYGGFTYTRTEEKAQIGPLHIQAEDKEHVNIPLWVGVRALAARCALGAVRLG
jgi:hypothetical protein